MVDDDSNIFKGNKYNNVVYFKILKKMKDRIFYCFICSQFLFGNFLEFSENLKKQFRITIKENHLLIDIMGSIIKKMI